MTFSKVTLKNTKTTIFPFLNLQRGEGTELMGHDFRANHVLHDLKMHPKFVDLIIKVHHQISKVLIQFPKKLKMNFQKALKYFDLLKVKLNININNINIKTGVLNKGFMRDLVLDEVKVDFETGLLQIKIGLPQNPTCELPFYFSQIIFPKI